MNSEDVAKDPLLALGCGASGAHLVPEVGVKLRCPAATEASARDPKLPNGGPADQSPGESERGPLRQTAGVDADDTVRFCALRLYESGLINSNPKKIIAENTDWRCFYELQRERKA